ncbi:MAG: purine-nucleoside phosphorylase, partial [Actinomycetota bacterium]
FFDGVEQVNAERGMHGYTGTFNGEPLSVQATGMGCPSSGIVFEELAMLGAQRLIRVGTCGGLQDGMAMGDTVIGVSASSDDTTPLRYADMAGYAPTASFELAATAAARSAAAGTNVHVGPIVTSGLFYDPDPNTFARWKRLGHLGVEMEAAMMYTVANVKGMQSLAMMTVSDLLADDGSTQRISDAELKSGIDRMMEIACEVAVS